MVYRLVEFFILPRRLGCGADEETSSRAAKSSKPRSPQYLLIRNMHAWLQKKFIVPTAIGTHHREPLLFCTIPTRMETVVIAAFWIINIAICSATYELFFPNL